MKFNEFAYLVKSAVILIAGKTLRNFRSGDNVWLLELYGNEYTDYCKRVNRCIPWFSKKN